jgi:hypothetical protein
MRKLVTRPPTMGAAIRFIRSAPVPVDHMMGSRPIMAAKTVMAFGRTRLTAPWMIASTSSCSSLSRPRALASSWERSRKSSMKTPVSASSPISAIMPTQTAMETL